MNAVTIIAYLIAIAIPAFTVYLFVALDIFGTGKFSTILLCLGWGAVGAYLLALTLNNATLHGLGVDYDTVVGFTGPVLEELLKAVFLVYLVSQPRFRYIVDGAVYGIAVGIGFALSENLFVYLPDSGSAVLGIAISRTLSTSLMHAAASGLVGLALGRLRRSRSAQKWGLLLSGLAFAIVLHVSYNNIVGELTGVQLLLVAIGIGVGGSIVIAWQINQGLVDEKKHFAETLGMGVDVSTGERKAVQNLGGTSIEMIFGELGEFFGNENSTQIRRLLVLQANIGILQNNLNSPVSDRLRTAWEEEIAELRAEMEKVRKELGAAVNVFLESVFPSSDKAMQDALNEEFGQYDPTMVHTFDMFMRVSELAGTFSPEQLVAMAERLNKIDIFKKVSLANLENLSRAIEVHTYADGETLFEQGDEGDAMFLIEEGQISIHPKTEPDKPIRTFDTGSVVGEFSLLDGKPRSTSAVARGTLRALVLQRQVFMKFIQSRPVVVLAMLQYLAEKARYTTHSVETSINLITQIAQGTYELPEEVPAVTAAPVVELEPAAITEDTAALIGGVISQAAAALQAQQRPTGTTG